MADLEDRILKKNIPGKYTWWDEYNENQPADRNEEANYDEYGNTAADEPQETIGHHAAAASASNDSAPPSARSSSSTKAGIKGVLENYKLDQEEAKRQALIDRLEKEQIVERNTIGTKMKPGEVSISLNATIEERKRLERLQRRQQSNDDDIDSDVDDDDDFIARYRQQRLQQLQQQRALPEFGGVEDVNPIQYSKAVDDTDPRVVLVVHVYETYIPNCRTLAPILETLSRELPNVRFLSLKASSFSSQLDPVALPSVLVHKGGALVANLTPITNDLPEHFGPKDVKELLSEYTTVVVNVDERIATRPVYPQSSGVVKTSTEKVFYNENDSDDELDEFCKDFAGTM